MAKSSSTTKKAAKLAQKGKGQKIRFQGGIIFPLAVALTLIAGLGLILYSRQSLPAADSSPPTTNDHWHAAYGFYLCDTWYQLNGNLEERDSRGQFTNIPFKQSGVHSHEDGVIHWHPYTSRAVGKNATLGVFLDSYEVEVTNDAIKFPPQNILGGQAEWIEGETQCDGKDAEVSVRVWDSFSDTDAGQRYIANVDKIHIDHDGMVFGIYFTNDDAPQTMPPWASELPTLGALDSNQIRPEDLLQSDTGVPNDPTNHVEDTPVGDQPIATVPLVGPTLPSSDQPDVSTVPTTATD